MNAKLLSALLLVLCLPLVVTGGGCDSANPVAPAGTTLSVTATPSRIAADGVSVIRVTALRANGTPVNPGTEVRLDTTLGTIDALVQVDDGGVAQAMLRGDGRIGTATVSARAGSTEAATVEVEIGEFARDIRLQATPSQVGPDESVDLLALVRDDEGRPLAGANVNFETQVGTLSSRGSIVITDSNGEASDRLRVSEEDILAFNAPSFNVTAAVGTEGGSSTAQVTIRIRAVAPRIQFFPTATTGNRVFFRNETQGSQPISYEWDFQSDGTPDSTEAEPTFDYGSPVQAIVTLRADNAEGSATAVCTFDVPVTASITCESE